MIVGVLGATLVAVPMVVWFARIPLAEAAVKQTCNDRGISCELDFEALTLNDVVVKNVSVSSSDTEELKVERAKLTLAWPETFRPLVMSVELEAADIVVDARGGQVRVPALEPLMGNDTGESNGQQLPPFQIKDGAVTILTDAGPLNAVVQIAGAMDREIRSEIVLAPAELQIDDNRLKLEKGEAKFVYSSDYLRGEADLQMEDISVEGIDARDVNLRGSLIPGEAGFYDLLWDSDLENLAIQSLEVTSLTSTGTANLRIPNLNDPQTIEVVSLQHEGRASWLLFGQHEFSGVETDMQLDRVGDTLAGDVSLEINERVAIDRALEASKLTLQGQLTEVSFAQLSADFAGNVVLREAVIAPTIRDKIQALSELPSPVTGHGYIVAQAIDHTLSSFSTGAQIDASLATIDGERRMSLTALSPINLRSEDQDALISLSPRSGQPTLSFKNGQLSAGGRLHLTRESADLSLLAEQFTFRSGDGNLNLQVRDGALAPLIADGNTLSVLADAIQYRQTPQDRSARFSGDMRWTGRLFGTELDYASARGAFAGFAPVDGPWAIRVVEDCLDLSWLGFSIGPVQLGRQFAEACMKDGMVFTRSGRGLSGAFTLTPIDTEITGPMGQGQLALAAPEVKWGVNRATTITLQSPSSVLEIAKGPLANLSTKSDGLLSTLTIEDGAPQLTSRLKDLFIARDGLPADIRIAELDLTGPITANGPELALSVLGASITDAVNERANALFKPLLLSGQGTLDSNDLILSGRLRLEEEDGYLGELFLDHSFAANAGHATLKDGSLVFSRTGLQPNDVSERLRGLAVNAVGRVAPEAQFWWSGSDLAGTGSVKVDDLGFSTFRLGRLRDISGTITLADLLDLRSETNQSLTIGEIELTPRISLTDGAIDMTLRSPSLLEIHSAQWPFAGGRIAFEPTLWRFDQPDQSVTVQATNWNLKELFQLFNVPDLDINGTISGAVPIDIEGPRVFFRDARLTSVDEGFIRYTSPYLETAGQSDQFAAMAFEALENFEYQLLSARADGELTDDITIDLSLSGRNPDVLRGQAFNLNVSLESKLARLLRSGSLSTSAQASQDMIVELVRQEQAEQSGQAAGPNE